MLSEGRGTCSTKHALLAQLASEQNFPVSLVLGIFEMDGLNTPEVAHVLSSYQLHSVPEAHCYLRFEKQIFDFTRCPPPCHSSYCQFEEIISPDQIGEHKLKTHKDYLHDWISEKSLKARFTFDEIWKIREQCILALSKVELYGGLK